MVLPATGSVVLVPFPFSDLSGSKFRPAVVLAQASSDDWVLCQVTSKGYGDPHAVALSGFRFGGLAVQSHARPGRLFTAHARLMVRSVADLDDETTRQVLGAVITLLSAAMP